MQIYSLYNLCASASSSLLHVWTWNYVTVQHKPCKVGITFLKKISFNLLKTTESNSFSIFIGGNFYFFISFLIFFCFLVFNKSNDIILFRYLSLRSILQNLMLVLQNTPIHSEITLPLYKTFPKSSTGDVLNSSNQLCYSRYLSLYDHMRIGSTGK